MPFCVSCTLHTQIYSELNQYQSLRFLDPLGSLLDGCAVDEATAAAASPAFMCGAVLLPLVDILVCQVSCTRAPRGNGFLLGMRHSHEAVRPVIVHTACFFSIQP